MAHLRTQLQLAGPALLLSLLTIVGGCAAPTYRSPATADAASSVNLPYAVPFVGVQDVFSRNSLGDAVVITAVHGSAGTIAIGQTYRIDGVYTLASHDRATLYAYETATQPNEPHREEIPGQSVNIQKGSGTFTVFLKVEDPGCPHVTLYPADRGEGFAGEYFGTGDFLPPASWQAKTGVAAG
jgi:hypothetical protein